MNKKYCIVFAMILALLLSSCGAGTSTSDYSHASGAPAADSAPSTAAPEEATDIMEGEYFDGESYLVIDENTETQVENESVLTFSLKVDTAAYTNVARYIESGNLPPRDAVRTEEMINYFNYDADMSFTDGPFAIYTEIGASPFDEAKHMAFVRVKTEEIDKSELPSSNLTFLIDTSGSMNSYDKLPLLQEALTLLVETLDEDDTVSIVTYAGSSAVVLDSVSGGKKSTILNAINSLGAGGSTAGAEGIVTAYALAEKNFMRGGNNRIILASDGDFNVGISNVEELKALISEKRDSGVYLSVLGFGTGNIRDDIMETLAANGNGNYSYINNTLTAQKVLVDELGANLFTVADDVKAQIEFNPENVKSYRLIGYENRMLNNRDFEDDTKDAGEIGMGTDVVLMFELELQNADAGLKYGSGTQESRIGYGDELFEVRIRYKDPGQSASKLILEPVTFESVLQVNSSDYQFACSVAAFGHLLRDSEYTGNATIENVLTMAEGSLGRDTGGYRLAYLEMLKQYRNIINW